VAKAHKRMRFRGACGCCKEFWAIVFVVPLSIVYSPKVLFLDKFRPAGSDVLNSYAEWYL